MTGSPLRPRHRYQPEIAPLSNPDQPLTEVMVLEILSPRDASFNLKDTAWWWFLAAPKHYGLGQIYAVLNQPQLLGQSLSQAKMGFIFLGNTAKAKELKQFMESSGKPNF
jgi:hypothetical protein